MKKFIISISFTLIVSYTISQSVNTDQFYTSTHSPIELNQKSSDRIASLYEYYSKKYEDKSKSEQKDYQGFVYRSNYFLEKLNKSGEVFYGDEISKYVNELKDYLIAKSNSKNLIKVYITRTPTLNAFTNDFGNIYINIATIAALRSEEDLLVILAHEISHVLLKHSYKFEEYSKQQKGKAEWKNDNEFEMIQKYSFSRKQENQADINAIKILAKIGITHEAVVSLLEYLRYASDPVMSGNYNFKLLSGNDAFLFNVLQENFNKNDSLYKQIKINLQEEKSTHPTLINRKENVLNTIEKKPFELEQVYSPIGDFLYFSNIAKRIVLNSYLEKGELIKGLDLVLKLRDKNPSDVSLIKIQAKLLTLLTQEKYEANPFNQFLNYEGSEYKDTTFICFKREFLGFNALEFNIISLISIKKLQEQYHLDYLDKTYWYLTNYLYKYNASLFEIRDKKLSIIQADSTLESKIKINELDLEFNLSRYEKEEYDNIIQSDSLVFVPYYSKIHTKPVLSYYITQYGFTDEQFKIVNEYKNQRNNYEYTLTLDKYNITNDPEEAFFAYKNGEYTKSKDFKIDENVALVQSLNYYLKKKDGEFYINHKRSLKLEEDVRNILDTLGYISQKFSESNKDIYRVKDINDYYILNSWIKERFKFDDLIFSNFDEEITSITKTNNLKYLLFNINIVYRQKKLFNPFITISYDLYFDVENNGVSYCSKNACNERPSNMIFKHLMYLSDYYKR